MARHSRIVGTARLLVLLVLLGLPAVVQAEDYTYTSDNGTITITGYTGPGGAVILPSTINGLPVTTIGVSAFQNNTSLTHVTIPNNVTTIGDNAFNGCTSLINVTIGNSIASVGSYAFFSCTNLTGVYFKANAPSRGDFVFLIANNATVYYLPGTTGWSATFSGQPTALWVLPNPLILNNGASFGVQTNGFGFIISWATNISVVVEACTNLVNPIWSSVGTNPLTGGSSYFGDPQWTNHPTRFYRLRLP